MTTTGRLTLMNNGQAIATKVYSSPSKKDIIIEGWKKLYGPAFKKAEVIDQLDEPGELFPHSPFKKGELPKTWKISKPANKSYPAERGAKEGR